MSLGLLVAGIAAALFVAYNIGGATTVPAFGPAVGANVVTKTGAAALMSVWLCEMLLVAPGVPSLLSHNGCQN